MSDAKQKKQNSLRKTQNDKIENVAVSIGLSMFMDGTGKCKLSPSP
jgi:hypothetical protein